MYLLTQKQASKHFSCNVKNVKVSFQMGELQQKIFVTPHALKYVKIALRTKTKKDKCNLTL